MTYITVLKQFLLKETFNFDRPDINLHNFHPQLRLFLAIKGVFFSNQTSYIRLIWPTYCILLASIGLGLEMMFIYRGVTIKDYSFATECFCYFIIVGTIPVVYISMFVNRKTILELVEDINDNFVHVCSLGPRYRQPFLDGQLLIWKLSFAWLIFVSITGLLYIIFPIVALMLQTLFTEQDENTIRPLACPVWLPKYDAYRTPNYEMFLFIEINFSFIVVQTFCVYIYVLFHILVNYIYIMDMIILDFEVIFDNLDESVMTLPPENSRRKETQQILNKRMKRIIKWHLLVFKALKSVSSVYGPPLVYQVLLSSFLICLIAYQVTEKLDNGNFDVLFAMLGAAAIIQLWIPCYLGTLLRNKAFEVGDACWNCGWHETALGRLLRMDIIIMILRTQHPVSIKFSGLPNLELETFSSIMSTAYSYFNMLRQYSK